MKYSSEQIKKLQSKGAKVKRIPPNPPKGKEPVVNEVVKVVSPPSIPDYGKELKALIITLDNRLKKTRVPWRIKVNRTNAGLAESYDLIPLEID